MPQLSRNTIILIGAIAIAGVAGIMTWDQSAKVGSGPAMVEVQVPKLSQTAQAGEELFNTYCASCHGRNAAGQDGVAPPLVHKIYEPNHHADRSFRRAARIGVHAHHWPFGNMPPVTGIEANEVDEVVAYVRELQRANGIH
jgi:mono/diheme cytochrome c family protein